MQVCHCLPQAIYFIPWHRYHPPGKFATAIVPESEAFFTRRVYERVAKMILFSCTTRELAVTAPSGSQERKGGKKKKEAYQEREPWTSSKSHAIALMMYNQSNRKSRRGRCCNWNNKNYLMTQCFTRGGHSWFAVPGLCPLWGLL